MILYETMSRLLISLRYYNHVNQSRVLDDRILSSEQLEKLSYVTIKCLITDRRTDKYLFETFEYSIDDVSFDRSGYGRIEIDLTMHPKYRKTRYQLESWRLMYEYLYNIDDSDSDSDDHVPKSMTAAELWMRMNK
eukprot:Lithocolla_globosa_v1_NODE_3148_length_1750_cov_81.515044.p2 type:complete len:135 gc:universal NODE_3148_length_1750_cov_81.515044:592-188(-)